MAASAKSGAQFVFGNLSAMLAAAFGSSVPDPDQDSGPSAFYQGLALMDPRILYTKDKVTGYTGVVQCLMMHPRYRSIGQIPAATASNNIAAAANVVNGTAMTLASATVGITLNVPIRPLSAVLNGAAPVTAAIALDFGFGFGNCTAGSTTIVVSNTAAYMPGMPLVIGGVGNAGGTVPLLTNVQSITDTTHIVVVNAPLATNATAPIGTGDLWGPSEVGFPTPLAAYPFLGGGPGLFKDSRQGVTRGVRVTGASGGAGGNFLVSGWDLYGQPMSELVTVGAGAVAGYGKKCFKYIGSVVPQFTDAHNYSVGTSDVFGFAIRAALYEETTVFWAAALMVTSQGWLAPSALTGSTTTTADVRSTIQTGAIGGGTGIGSTASNGTVVSLAMSGNRLEMDSFPSAIASLLATQADASTLFGATQA